MIKTVYRKLAVVPAVTMLLATVVVATNSQIASAQEYQKFTRIGTSQSVCAGGIETAEELHDFFAKNPDALRAIMADSGWSGDVDSIVAAIATGDMVEKSYPVGQRFAWTSAKVNGQFVAKRYREWAGSKSLDSFQMNVSSGCQVYHFAIPKACCNISLVSATPDTSEACQPKPVVAAPAPAPEPEPEPVKAALRLIPFFGLFAGSETRPRYEPAWDMDMKDSSSIIGLRAGLMKELSEKTSVFGQLSYYDRGGINEYNVYPENNLAVDIGVDRKLTERTFIGGGIGLWNVDDSDYRDTSIFGHVGGDIGATNLQWFLEGRLFDSDSVNHDSLSDNKMFSAGVRYLVK